MSSSDECDPVSESRSKSKNQNEKLDFKELDDDEILEFLDNIKSHPALYDKKNGGYKNLRNKALLYKKIEEKFGFISNVHNFDSFPVDMV